MDAQDGMPQGFLRSRLQTQFRTWSVNTGDEEEMQDRLVITPLWMLYQAYEATSETQFLDAWELSLLWQVWDVYEEEEAEKQPL